MTLYRQLVIAISFLLGMLFLGTWITNLQSTRAFLEEQLASHAQDTATSLGLSLSPHMQANDMATMASMVDSIFDRGYYTEIVISNMDGSPIIERRLPVRVENVPAWFVDWIALTPPARNAPIMTGWKQVATITVSSHPGYAYRELWSSTMMMLAWFAALTLLSIIITSIILRFLLKPLQAVERQADAISDHRYEIQEKLPRTRELRSVVAAMNKMTHKVQEMFETQARTTEQLRALAYADPLTGLNNRHHIENHARALLDTAGAVQGSLMLIRLEGLNELNESRGFAAGDNFLKAAASRIKALMESDEHTLLARLAGGDIAILTNSKSNTQMDELAAQLAAQLALLLQDGSAHDQNVVHIGIATHQPEETLHDLLAKADSALRSAQANGANGWARFHTAEGSSQQAPGRQQWIGRIKKAIAEKQFVLHAQPAIALKAPQHPLHHELLPRLADDEGNLFAAERFIPIATQLGIIQEIDYQIIEKIATLPATLRTPAPLAVNISSATMKDEAVLERIMTLLQGCATPLIFEISEFIAVRELQRLKAFAERVQTMGHHIAIDHFGQAFGSFGYLQSLRPIHVKIDRSFSHDLENDKDTQFYLRSLCSVAHSLDIQTIISGFEDPEQWHLLESLNIDGAQGYAAGGVVPVEKIGE